MRKKSHIEQVRQALLDTLGALRDSDNPMDIDRARAVAHVASVLVDSAKVEIDYLKITGQGHSDFISGDCDGDDQYPALIAPTAHNPFPVSMRHRIGD